MDTFNEIFDLQKLLQRHVTKNYDSNLTDIVKFYNSCTAAMVELGELLQSDTSWKKQITGSTKTPVKDVENVKKEFADVFLYLFNAIIYYGLDINDIKRKISDVQDDNYERLTQISLKRIKVRNE